jgi:hypothetical protein
MGTLHGGVLCDLADAVMGMPNPITDGIRWGIAIGSGGIVFFKGYDPIEVVESRAGGTTDA